MGVPETPVKTPTDTSTGAKPDTSTGKQAEASGVRSKRASYAVHVIPGTRKRWFPRILLICIVGAGVGLFFYPDKLSVSLIGGRLPVDVGPILQKPQAVYKWVDSSGQTRYSNTPPLEKGQAYEKTEVEIRNTVAIKNSGPAGHLQDSLGKGWWAVKRAANKASRFVMDIFNDPQADPPQTFQLAPAPARQE
ncbi:MAG: DUF4124 domain-containing protein [Nitrospirota bacterium]|nr:DUF4124 domain-containing protein [Nitrospirota bacterium]